VVEQIEQSLIPALDDLPPITMLNQEMGMPLDMFLKLYE